MSGSKLHIRAALAVASLVVVVVGCRPAAKSVASSSAAEPVWLTVVSPHSAQIREAFALAFSDWYYRQHNRTVYVDWVVRGTPECLAYVAQAYDAMGTPEANVRADVMFGGGLEDHIRLAERGYSLPLQLAGVLEGVPDAVAGVPTRDAEGHYFATGLSTFGILVNVGRAEQWGIAPPATWDDLADPRLAGWLGIADPGASGSHLQCMILVLQKYGWDDGWSRIIRMLANSRALVERSSSAQQQTRNGVFLASFAVNFDGQRMESEVASELRYVNPAGATALTPDMISALKCADDRTLAESFVRFCLTDGQTLWGLRPADGGSGTPLYHYPIQPAVYAEHADRLSVPGNPFEQDFGIRYDAEQAAVQGPLLTALVEAACGENHVALQQAWRAVAAAGMPEEALRELTAAPLSADEAMRLGGELRSGVTDSAELVATWSRGFAERYRRVQELAR